MLTFLSLTSSTGTPSNLGTSIEREIENIRIQITLVIILFAILIIILIIIAGSINSKIANLKNDESQTKINNDGITPEERDLLNKYKTLSMKEKNELDKAIKDLQSKKGR